MTMEHIPKEESEKKMFRPFLKGNTSVGHSADALARKEEEADALGDKIRAAQAELQKKLRENPDKLLIDEEK